MNSALLLKLCVTFCIKSSGSPTPLNPPGINLTWACNLFPVGTLPETLSSFSRTLWKLFDNKNPHFLLLILSYKALCSGDKCSVKDELVLRKQQQQQKGWASSHVKQTPVSMVPLEFAAWNWGNCEELLRMFHGTQKGQHSPWAANFIYLKWTCTTSPLR